MYFKAPFCTIQGEILMNCPKCNGYMSYTKKGWYCKKCQAYATPAITSSSLNTNTKKKTNDTVKIIVSFILLFLDIGFLLNFHSYNQYNKLFTITFILLSVTLIIRWVYSAFKSKKIKETSKVPCNNHTPSKTTEENKKHAIPHKTEITSVTNQISSKTAQGTSTFPSAKDTSNYPQYIGTGSTISHVDNSPITDEEVSYLMQLGYSEALHAEAKLDNPIFHRTEREDELSFAFMMKYGRDLSVYTEQFENLYHAAYETNNLSKKIELLNHSLLAFERAKKFAYSKGKGGTIYFQDMYEHMHNSRNNCFSYADIIQSSLDWVIQERDVIIPGILQIVNDNDGILQKNIYDKLPSISRSDIQREIRKLENEHILTRTKKSNSYELHIIRPSN